jgi:hypothetical protein
MALFSIRNAPIAALFSLPTLAMGLGDRLRSWRPGHARPMRTTVRLARRLMETGLALVVVVAALVITLPGSPGLAPDPTRFPVTAMDRLTELDPDARLLAEYGWGGYAVSRLYPEGGRVFVDGRNDMYDDAILETYSAIRAAEEGWEVELDRWNVEAVLLPPDAPLVRGPLQDAGWCEVHRDDLAVLLLPECPAA